MKQKCQIYIACLILIRQGLFSIDSLLMSAALVGSSGVLVPVKTSMLYCLKVTFLCKAKLVDVDMTCVIVTEAVHSNWVQYRQSWLPLHIWKNVLISITSESSAVKRSWRSAVVIVQVSSTSTCILQLPRSHGHISLASRILIKRNYVLCPSPIGLPLIWPSVGRLCWPVSLTSSLLLSLGLKRKTLAGGLHSWFYVSHIKKVRCKSLFLKIEPISVIGVWLSMKSVLKYGRNIIFLCSLKKRILSSTGGCPCLSSLSGPVAGNW